ncbi:MAG: YcbX family protein [Thalassotalea sp.]
MTKNSTTTPILSEINVYPIKSTAAISLSNTWVDELGLSFDRRFVLSDVNGEFITARKKPKLALIQVNIVAYGLILTAPNMSSLSILFQDFSPSYQNVTVWRDEIKGQLCHPTYDQWFSEYLQKPCTLLYFGQQSERRVKNQQQQVAYADGYPLLLIAQASLTALNERSPRNNVMAQFRPNIVIDNCEAFAEDGWQKIKIGEVTFEIVKPCSRCIFTTINPVTGEFEKSKEPLTSLAKFRKGDDNEIYFGQNLIALNTGQIKNGDQVEVLSRKTAEFYPDLVKHTQEYKPFAAKSSNSTTDKLSSDNSPKENSSANFDTITTNKLNDSKQSQTNNLLNTESMKVPKKVKIMFDSWNISHQGNTKDTLLDQGEDAGLIMHYSCRGGNCGRCKVKLQSGEVEQLTTDGLMPQEQEEGYILACSSIPQSDLVITKN